MLGLGGGEAGLLSLNLLTLLQDTILFFTSPELLFRSLSLFVGLLLLAPGLLLFFDTAQASFFFLLKDLPSVTLLFLNGAEPRLFLEFESRQAELLFLLKLRQALSFLLLQLCEALMLFLLEPKLALLLFLLKAGLRAVFFAPHALQTLSFLLLNTSLALSLVRCKSHLMQKVLFFNLFTASIFFSIALQTLILLKSDLFLTLLLLLGKLTLALELISLSLQSLFFLLGCTLLLSSLGSKHASFGSLLLETEALGLLLLLPSLLLSLKLLLAKSKLLFIPLGLETLGLLQLALVHLGELSRNHGLMLLLFLLDSRLLLFESLATSSILSFVFEPVGLVHGGQLFLAGFFVSLSLEAGFFLFFG